MGGDHFVLRNFICGKISTRVVTQNSHCSSGLYGKANLEYSFNIKEIKSVPYCPWSRHFFKRFMGRCRLVFTDPILFWSELDLVAMISVFQEYFNSYRIHYSHDGKPQMT